MAVMYTAMVFGLAELGSALPTAGGGYTFARRALGPWGGYATGVAVLIEYAIAPAAIATFIGAYVESLGLFGITDGWWVYLAAYALFIGVHLMGVGEGAQGHARRGRSVRRGRSAGVPDRRRAGVQTRAPAGHPRHRRESVASSFLPYG
jgi:amino acid transporter